MIEQEILNIQKGTLDVISMMVDDICKLQMLILALSFSLLLFLGLFYYNNYKLNKRIKNLEDLNQFREKKD